MKKARSVGNEAHRIPTLSSMADQIAVLGLSHVMSVVWVRM